jgi:TetR/AcrR family transcriptional regulator, transcriptional repressor for nem operon
MSKAERTRQFIIEKTAHLFNTKGYAGTSLSDIEKVTGLTKGSIYGNFANKDEIAVAAFKHNISLVTSEIKNEILAREGIIDKLLVYPATYRNFFKYSYLDGGCPILNTSTEADDTHPVLRKAVRAVVNSWRASLESLIKEGIEKKEIRKDVKAEVFSTLMVALIEGAVMMAKLNNDRVALNISMDYLEKMIKDLKA